MSGEKELRPTPKHRPLVLHGSENHPVALQCEFSFIVRPLRFVEFGYMRATSSAIPPLLVLFVFAVALAVAVSFGGCDDA